MPQTDRGRLRKHRRKWEVLKILIWEYQSTIWALPQTWNFSLVKNYFITTWRLLFFSPKINFVLFSQKSKLQLLLHQNLCFLSFECFFWFYSKTNFISRAQASHYISLSLTNFVSTLKKKFLSVNPFSKNLIYTYRFLFLKHIWIEIIH